MDTPSRQKQSKKVHSEQGLRGAEKIASLPSVEQKNLKSHRSGHRRSSSQPSKIDTIHDVSGDDIYSARSYSPMSKAVGGGPVSENSTGADFLEANDTSFRSLSSNSFPLKAQIMTATNRTFEEADEGEYFGFPDPDELSHTSRSVKSSRSMRTISPPGQNPRFKPEFEYLSRTPSKQSGIDADPMEMHMKSRKTVGPNPKTRMVVRESPMARYGSKPKPVEDPFGSFEERPMGSTFDYAEADPIIEPRQSWSHSPYSRTGSPPGKSPPLFWLKNPSSVSK